MLCCHTKQGQERVQPADGRSATPSVSQCYTNVKPATLELFRHMFINKTHSIQSTDITPCLASWNRARPSPATLCTTQPQRLLIPGSTTCSKSNSWCSAAEMKGGRRAGLSPPAPKGSPPGSQPCRIDEQRSCGA